MKKLLSEFDSRRVLVAPSLLAADFAFLANEVQRIEEAGADLLHLDVMDAHFVPNLTMGPALISSLRKHSSLPFDTHLMLADPLKYVKPFVDAGSDHITFHVESDNDPLEVIAAIREQGASVGVSIKPKTPASAVASLLEKVDLVLVMSVEPGFGGQSFMSEVVPKITELRAMANRVNPRLHIEVDGGIGGKTAPVVVTEGANMLVAGTSVFRAPDAAAAVQQLHDTQKLLPQQDRK
ncbi:MAG: ribulose-phosphate 3-epimerase [Lentisphaeria bacterium]|nr:ribulose-phosphate 3-epimerase [Lentisphaeria bacterium]